VLTRLSILASFAAVLLLAGCGDNEKATQSSPSHPAATTTTAKPTPRTDTRLRHSTLTLTLTQQSPPPPPPKPEPKPKPATGASTWSDAVVSPYTISKRDVYQQSRDVCSVFSAEQVAKEYKAESSSPVAAAIAYAEATYQPVFQQPATDGCLDGFG
jgi:nitrous oxide reductase accessory protein NosL